MIIFVKYSIDSKRTSSFMFEIRMLEFNRIQMNKIIYYLKFIVYTVCRHYLGEQDYCLRRVNDNNENIKMIRRGNQKLSKYLIKV